MRDMLDILKAHQQEDRGRATCSARDLKDIAGQYAVTSFGTLMRAVRAASSRPCAKA